MKKKRDKAKERRKYLRFENGTTLKIKVKKKAKKRYQQKKIGALAINLSAEGISFEASEEFKRGDLVKFELFFGGSNPIHIEGKVVWSHLKPGEKDKYLVGAKLFTLDKSDETKFLRYISDKMTQQLSRYLHL